MEHDGQGKVLPLVHAQLVQCPMCTVPLDGHQDAVAGMKEFLLFAHQISNFLHFQVQFKNDIYSGMIDAGRKIYRKEGVSGLYRGFWISAVQIFSGSCYIYTYEGVRHLCTKYGAGPTVKSLLAGGCASLVGQTLIVPFDVISQHMMVLGMVAQGKGDMNPLGIRTNANESKFRLTVNIAKEIYRRDGFIGFYRGYLASLMAYVPNSAMWWSFYHLYQGMRN